MFDEVTHFGRRFPTYRSGLISSTKDSIISYFLSFGTNDCAGGGTIDPGTYQSGLLAFRDRNPLQYGVPSLCVNCQRPSGPSAAWMSSRG